MRSSLLVLLLALPACGPCTPVSPDAGPEPGTGVLEVRTPAAGGGLQVRLRDLDVPLRAVQVDIGLSGTVATSVAAAGQVPHDIIEAGLDEPKSSFTLVVSDSRRLPLADGAIASVQTGAAPSQIDLSNAFGVDLEGRRVELDVEVSP